MKNIFRIVPIAMSLTVALGAATLPARPAVADGGSGNGSEVRTRINLTGAVINGVLPKGRAEFRTSTEFRSFKVQVEQVNLPDGTTLNVAVNGSTIGVLRLALRRAEIERSTKDRQTVPVIKTGDIVTVTNASGNLILQGRF